MIMKTEFCIPDHNWTTVDVPEGTVIEDLYRKYGSDAPYTCIAAKVDNEYRSLTDRLDKPCRIELLDVRDQGACRVYQAGIAMVFLAAAKKVIGETKCILANTLAHGIFIELKNTSGATDEMAEKIRKEMQSIIDRDAKIERRFLTRDEAIEQIRESGNEEKLNLFDLNPDIEKLELYELDGYSEFLFPVMVPSAGYVDLFTLERYKKGLLMRFPDRYHPDGIPEFVDEPNMYKAFAEQNEWGKLLGVGYVADLNKKIEQGESTDLIQLSEALHDKKITEIANMITEQGKRLVLIAGPSSSGKTTFAKRLCIHLRVNGCKALYMGTDDYFVDREELEPDENGEIDYENLNAVDTKLFNDNMRDLLAGKEVDIPEFDFIEGKKLFGKRKTRIDDKTVLVIEGIHALNKVLTSEISKSDKFKIYISPLTGLNIDAHNRVPTTDMRLLRRIVRDERTRGRDAAETIADWPKVRRGEDRNIFRYNDEADVMFNSHHVYEIAALKKYVEPLLKKITREQTEYAEARRLLATLSFFREIDDDSAIMNDSILREFIGGSIYVS